MQPGQIIVNKEMIPRGEERIYLDYLPDRETGRYRLPASVDQAVIYLYEGDKALTLQSFAKCYPKTWRYLVKNRSKLESRGPGKTPWWRPERPRDSSRMGRPKIVCPHLMLTPRFALDTKAQFVVSHAPFMIANELNEELTLLRFFLAVLNSSVSSWYLTTYAPKYANGYNRLEANLLKNLPVPDISRIDTGELRHIAGSVGRLGSEKDNSSLDSRIDKLIADLYGFSSRERGEILAWIDAGIQRKRTRAIAKEACDH